MTGSAITPDLLLRAYALGIFPMAESRHDPTVHWVDPRRRGILPLDGLRISRSLRRTLLREPFRISTDTAFEAVLDGCADRPETWINDTIRSLCLTLHRAGHAHSLEVWDDAELVGGVYGIALGGAFFGESMFSRRRDASKIALAYLVDRLRVGGFALFDTQFLTPHLASLGAVEIGRDRFQAMLQAAIRRPADFARQGIAPPAQDLVQRNSQTSNRA